MLKKSLNKNYENELLPKIADKKTCQQNGQQKMLTKVDNKIVNKIRLIKIVNNYFKAPFINIFC